MIDKSNKYTLTNSFNKYTLTNLARVSKYTDYSRNQTG